MINIRMNAVDTSSSKKLSPKITVVGIGGAGGNAVNNMISSNLIGVDFVVCNTDSQALLGNLADHKVQLGASLTEGLGAGAKPEIGRAAAEESLDDVMQHLDNTNMAFITAGMGGGTGTGAASVVARACRERGILTVGVVTKPFHFEGTHRMRLAEEGIAELQNYVDTLIVIPNQNLFRIVNDRTTFAEAFKMADSVLQSAVRGVTDLIVMEGMINLDFADIRSVMQEMGKAVMGVGEASGDGRATEAAEKAISNPLLDDISMKGARGVIINVTGGHDMTLFEVDEACNRIRDEVDPNANIIFGSTFDENMEGTMRVSVVATGIDTALQAAEKKGKASSGGFAVERPRGSRYGEGEVAPSLSYRHASPQARAFAPAAQAASASRSPAIAAGRGEEESLPPYGHQTTLRATEETPVAAAAGYQADQDQGELAPRGERIGGAYIPPQPVEGARTGYEPRQQQVQQQQPAQPPIMKSAAAYPAQAHQNQGQGQGQEQEPGERGYAPSSSSPYGRSAYEAAPAPLPRKKGPSLFERITGQYRRADPVEEGPSYVPSSSQQQIGAASPVPGSVAPAPVLRAPQRSGYQNPAQGRLNIDVSAAPAPRPGEQQEELDIPAFLRRQTS